MSHDSIRTTFDAWAAAGRAEEMERRHLAVARQVIDPMPVRPGMQLLDHGCGGGWATRILGKKAPGAQAIGIDVSPGMIAKAEALSDWTSRARFECMPFEALTFGDRRFDRVFSMEALYYAVDLTAALAELFRATERWSADLGLPHLAWLGSEEWRERLAAAGFEPGEVGRLRAAEDDTPAPDDHGDLAEVRAAGTLWLHATRPA
jgi:cyclopropane fatty-acyl-phospholipid synthase-like methyltransferase